MTDQPDESNSSSKTVLTGRERWRQEHAQIPQAPPDEGSTYHQRGQIDLELDRARSSYQAYIVGSEEAVRPPLVGNDWAKADTAIEPPLGDLEPGDLRSAILGEALGGASQPAQALWVCPYNQADGCILVTGGVGPCLCERTAR